MRYRNKFWEGVAVSAACLLHVSPFRGILLDIYYVSRGNSSLSLGDSNYFVSDGGAGPAKHPPRRRGSQRQRRSSTTNVCASLKRTQTDTTPFRSHSQYAGLECRYTTTSTAGDTRRHVGSRQQIGRRRGVSSNTTPFSPLALSNSPAPPVLLTCFFCSSDVPRLLCYLQLA